MDQALSLRHHLTGPVISWPSLRGGAVGLIVCVCVAMIGMQGWQLWQVHEANIQRAEMVTANTAINGRAGEQHHQDRGYDRRQPG